MMEQIISLIVANGLWAVLFCGLLVYELRDGRSREQKYTQTIRSLTDRLDMVIAVKADTADIKTDTGALLGRAEVLCDGQEDIKRALGANKRRRGGATCATN